MKNACSILLMILAVSCSSIDDINNRLFPLGGTPLSGWRKTIYTESFTGTPNIAYYKKLGVYNNRLLVAHRFADSTPLMYDGMGWTAVPTNGLPDGTSFAQQVNMGAACKGGIYNGLLYTYTDGSEASFIVIGVGGPVDPTAHCLRSFDGTSWNFVNSSEFDQGSVGLGYHSKVFAYANFRDCLYLGGHFIISNGMQHPAIWKYDGTNMSKVYLESPPAHYYKAIVSLCSLQNSRLFALTSTWDDYSDLMMYSDNGSTWIVDTNFYNAIGTAGSADYITAMCEYNGRLYVGVAYTFSRTRLLWWDGTNWTKGPEFGDESSIETVLDMAAFNGKLYIATGPWGGNTLNGHIYSFDGTSYTDEFTNNFKSVNRIIGFAAFQGKLYANYYSYNPDYEAGILVREP